MARQGINFDQVIAKTVHVDGSGNLHPQNWKIRSSAKHEEEKPAFCRLSPDDLNELRRDMAESGAQASSKLSWANNLAASLLLDFRFYLASS